MNRPLNYFNLRRNTTTGCIERNDSSCVFSEWWNGEGIDFVFNDKTRVELHADQLHAIVVGSVLMGMIDQEEVGEDVKKLKESWVKFQQFMENNYDESK